MKKEGFPFKKFFSRDPGIPFDKNAYIRELMQTGQYREANVWTRVIIREQETALEHMYFFLAFVEQYAKEIGDDRRPFTLETWEKAYEIWQRQQKDHEA